MGKVRTAPKKDTSVPFVVTLTGHSGPVNAVAMLLGENGNDLVASGRDDSSVKLWNPWTYTCEQTLNGHTDAVTCLVVGKRSNKGKIWHSFRGEWQQGQDTEGLGQKYGVRPLGDGNRISRYTCGR